MQNSELHSGERGLVNSVARETEAGLLILGALVLLSPLIYSWPGWLSSLPSSNSTVVNKTKAPLSMWLWRGLWCCVTTTFCRIRLVLRKDGIIWKLKRRKMVITASAQNTTTIWKRKLVAGSYTMEAIEDLLEKTALRNSSASRTLELSLGSRVWVESRSKRD